MFKDVGRTWVATIDGKQWPVVLCGHEAAPPAFLSLREDPEHMPAIQLGRHMYIFVHDRMLHAFDPHSLNAFPQKDIQQGDSAEVVEEKQRRKAYGHDALQYGDHHFWANYISTQYQIRRLERERRGLPRTPQKPHSRLGKRDVTNPDYSRGFEPALKRQKLSSIQSSRQQPTRTRTPRKSQYQKDPIAKAIEISDDDSEGKSDDDGSHDEVVPVPASYLGTRRISTKDSRGIVASIEGSNGAARPTRSPASSSGRAPGPHECVLVFARGERKRLLVSKYVIGKSDYFNNRECEGENAVQLSLIENKRANDGKLTASDISAVLQYYQTSDIGPRLTNKPGADHQVSQLDLSDNRKAAHVEMLSKAFVTAVKIEDEDLQSLIYQKLQVLAPFSSLAILILARCVTGLAALATPGDEITTWITDLVKQYFWLLAKEHTDSLRDTLEQNNVMRVAVYDYLRDNPQGGKEGYGEYDDE